MENKKISPMNLIAIMSVYFLANGLLAINPILQKLIEAFPDVPRTTILMLSTLPSVAGLIFTLIVGAVAGTKVKFKTIQAVGVICFVAGGFLPAIIYTSMSFILACRLLLGVGIGCFGCISALLMKTYVEENKRARFLGVGMVIQNIGGILLQMLGGFLGDIKWNVAFDVYLIGIVSLILILLFMREPQKLDATKNSDNIKMKINGKVWIYTIFIILATMWLYPLLTNMSSFIELSNLGGAAIAGTILSLYTVGGMVGGAFFGVLYKYTQKFIVTIICLFIAGGQAIVLYCNSLILIGIGTFMCGIGFFCLIPLLMMFTGIVSSEKTMPVSTTLIMAGIQAGVFISTYWVTFTGNMYGNIITGAYFFSQILFGAVGIVFMIIDPRPKQKLINNL